MSSRSSGVEPPLLACEDLSKTFHRRGGLLRGPGERSEVRAVQGVDLALASGECFGLVGESGCGKSTLARMLLRLVDPSVGRILFDGDDVTGFDRSGLRSFRRDCQMVFQDPSGSLDPRMRVSAAVREPLAIHGLVEPRTEGARVAELLEQVGLSPSIAARLPGELSGGQRQRVAIARALATQPRVLAADEPVTALDVSVRAQILSLLDRLRRELRLTLLFIGHDLSVVEQLADRVGVMFAGRLVEVAPRLQLYGRPAHPYSVELLAAMPRFRRRGPRRSMSAGLDSREPTRGCPYRLRCPLAVDRCARERPLLAPTGDGRLVACHRPGELEVPATPSQRAGAG